MAEVNHKQPPEMSAFHQQIPEEPGRKAAIFLAVLMHLLLILLLWVGIRWQSEAPVGVEAEIWDMTTRTAAPAAPPTPPVPAPAEQTPPTTPKVKEPEPVKKEREQEKEKEREKEAEIAIERAREKKRIEEKHRAEKQKEEKKKEEKKKQELAKIAEQKKAEALLAQQRSDNLKRLTGQVGGTGDAVKSTGNNRADPSYAGRIAAKIKSNMVYLGADHGSDNPTVDFVINLFPDGSLKGPPRKTKSSGVAAFDDAVQRAITKSAPYPADKSGNVPSTIPLTYRLKD